MSNNISGLSKSAAAKLTFEQALTRLDGTVQALEMGDLQLSEATRLYEEGMFLAQVCSQKLTEAEIRITKVQTAYGDQIDQLAGKQIQTEEIDGLGTSL